MNSRRRSSLQGNKKPAIVVTDVMEAGAPVAARASTRKAALGTVDILINCAGGSKPAVHVDTPEQRLGRIADAELQFGCANSHTRCCRA